MRSSKRASLRSIIVALSVGGTSAAFGQMMIPPPNIETQLFTRVIFMNASPDSGRFWVVGSGLGDFSNVSVTIHRIEGDGLRLVAQKRTEYLAGGDELTGQLTPIDQFGSTHRLIVCVAFDWNSEKQDVIRFYSIDRTEWPPAPNPRRFRPSVNEKNGNPRMCSDVKAAAARFLK